MVRRARPVAARLTAITAVGPRPVARRWSATCPRRDAGRGCDGLPAQGRVLSPNVSWVTGWTSNAPISAAGPTTRRKPFPRWSCSGAERPAKVIFVVVTDGHEDASRGSNVERGARLIEAMQACRDCMVPERRPRRVRRCRPHGRRLRIPRRILQVEGRERPRPGHGFDERPRASARGGREGRVRRHRTRAGWRVMPQARDARWSGCSASPTGSPCSTTTIACCS